MNINKVDHIGIAVSNLEESVKFYTDVLGLKLLEMEEVPEQKVRVACLACGETRIELLEATSPDSPIAKHIENKGEGVQHIAYGVSDVEKAIEIMKENNVRMIDEKPRIGAGHAKIAFAHPKSTGSVLVELCERK